MIQDKKKADDYVIEKGYERALKSLNDLHNKVFGEIKSIKDYNRFEKICLVINYIKQEYGTRNY